jgi:hypothetical protein
VLAGEYGPRPPLHKLYHGIRLTTEENHGKSLVGVAEMRPTAYRWARFVWSTWCRYTGDIDRSAGRHHIWLAPLVGVCVVVVCVCVCARAFMCGCACVRLCEWVCVRMCVFGCVCA